MTAKKNNGRRITSISTVADCGELSIYRNDSSRLLEAGARKRDDKNQSDAPRRFNSFWVSVAGRLRLYRCGEQNGNGRVMAHSIFNTDFFALFDKPVLYV